MDYLEQSRERALDFLAECYADSLVTLDEYESRVDLVTAADSVSQVERAVADVRQLAERSRDPVPSADPGQNVVAIMTSRRLEGNWLRNRFVQSTSIMASNELDLRECQLGGEHRIHIVSIMAETTVIVPDGVEVRCEITPLLAEISDRSRRSGTGTRRVILSGVAIMSEVKIRRA